ncbi:MAG: hypothetical protein H6Q20_1693 [Bacteroidetes bacterium]|jgi:hypothetical protein|nr:hypothetical protein [Bacteroidota bacterium]
MIASPIYNNRQLRYFYTIDIVNKIIYVKISGNIYENEAAEMGIFFRKKALETDCKLFFDFSEAYNFILMGSAYFWFEHYYDKIDEKIRYTPTAYIMNPEQESFYNFIQTVCLNHGINIRVYKSEEQAVKWLMQKQQSEEKKNAVN